MVKINEETKNFFISDESALMKYLDSRNVRNQVYRNFLMQTPMGCLEANTFSVNGECYGVSHFLSVSNIEGFDIQKANKNLGLDKGNIMAIALVEGDDVLCMNIKTGEVFLWMISCGNGEEVLVSKTFTEFLDMISFD